MRGLLETVSAYGHGDDETYIVTSDGVEHSCISSELSITGCAHQMRYSIGDKLSFIGSNGVLRLAEVHEPDCDDCAAQALLLAMMPALLVLAGDVDDDNDDEPAGFPDEADPDCGGDGP